jgi:ABC-type bacteriocin/lantibiotic exporter with double-glycine peptidase domain
MELQIKNLFLNFFSSAKTDIFLYLFLGLSYPLGTIVSPHFYGKLIDEIVNKNVKTSTLKYIVITWSIYITGIYFLTFLDNKVIPNFRSYLYKNIASFIFDAYKQNYTSLKIGEMISKLSKLPFLVLEVFYQLKNNYLPLAYMIIFTIIYFSTIDKILALSIVVMVIVFSAVMYCSMKNCMNFCINAESSSDDSNEDLQDILENILNVYTSDSIESELDRLDIKDINNKEYLKKCMSCASKYKTSFSLLYLTFFMIIAKYVYELYKRNKINMSQVNSIFMVLLYLLSYVDSSLQYSQDTISYIGSIIDIQNYLDGINKNTCDQQYYVSKMNENLYTASVSELQGHVEFKNITVCFGDKCIIENFSYIITPKSKVAIVGNVGRGKSTLLKLILKLHSPTSGTILIDGKNLPCNVIRQNVSYIQQSPTLFNRKLYENIVYGTGKTKEDVIRLMKTYNLNSVFGKHTLDSDVGKGGNNLSGGQKQMVIVLRAILKGSKIILIDEPTSSLNKALKTIMMNLIFTVFRDSTVIMITHDEDVIPMFKTVLKL